MDIRIRYGEMSAKRFKWYVSRTFATSIKKSMRAFEHYTSDGGMDDSKRRIETFDGVPIFPVLDLPQTGDTSSTAATKWSAVLIDWEAYRPAFYPGWKFDMTKWVDVPGTVGVQAALFKIGGQNMCAPVGSMALLCNGETY
jgi:hypothetical protein